MEYTFTKLSDVEILAKVPKNATAFVEVDGAIKRVPGNGLGGGGYSLFIKNNGDNIIPNMTFEEAIVALTNGELTGAWYCYVGEYLEPLSVNYGFNDNSQWLQIQSDSFTRYWSAEEGFSFEEPGSNSGAPM